MYVADSSFELPENLNSKVWRYLDLTKFMSLLETSSLYFCRSDKFEDQYEGILSLKSIEDITSTFKDSPNYEELVQQVENLFLQTRKLNLVNCWHLNEHESDAMWKLYSNLNQGVAIQSTLGRLIEAFDASEEKIKIGNVKYIDFDTEYTGYSTGLGPILYKRKSFEHEKEIRVVYNTLPESENIQEEVEIKFVPHGQNIKIDLEKLIEQIYVSPTAPFWFYDLIKSILKRYQMKDLLYQSKLYTLPSRSVISRKSDEKIILKKEIIEEINKKDSIRIALEKEERERILKKEYDSIMCSFEELQTTLNNSKFKSPNSQEVLNGESAILAFSNYLSRINNRDKIQNLIDNDFFYSIYFLMAYFDKVFLEILNSKLTVSEKEILFKRLFYLYSSKLVKPLLNILVKLKNMNISNQLIEPIFSTFSKFKSFMEEFKY